MIECYNAHIHHMCEAQIEHRSLGVDNKGKRKTHV